MSNLSSKFTDQILNNSWNEFRSVQLQPVSIENFFSPLADSGFMILIYSELYSLYFLVFNRVLYCNHSWNLQIMLPQ